ncbi:hypothetical protein BC827DRAFT_1376981 [Russula dissimulans]|nr:hypothetical protein BC827DRAFT_1376981 [Russula dissimulans]
MLPSPPPPSTVTAKTISEEAIEQAREILPKILSDDSADEIRRRLRLIWSIVHDILHRTGNITKDRLRDEHEFNAYVKPGSHVEQELVELLRSMVNNQVPWSDLFENEAFIKPERETTFTLDRDRPTILAWGSTFKGDLANVLLEIIADYLSLERTPYARLTSIVNSSGTGKSRMVDQLGKEIITVPMCLRPSSQGFPPPDRNLRDWLIVRIGDRATVQTRLHAFAYSLLVVTQRELETIVSKKQDIPVSRRAEGSAKTLSKHDVSLVIDRHRSLASAFHEHMTTGQSYNASNSDREIFYDKVIELADQFVKTSERVGDPEHGRYTSACEGLHEAGKRLCRFIDEHKVLESDKGPRRPLVVLAFDEAHSLTDNPSYPKGWNVFTELRRILRQIKDLPIFSVFLSTAGRFDKLPPEIHSEPSGRAREPDNHPLSSISEISFDDIAYPALRDTVTIDRVVDIDWICHLGRPLFGSYWDNLPLLLKEELTIMDYAKQKLLNGPNELRRDNSTGTLACLSVRFALEFNMDDSARDVSYTQVERHMRLFIAATDGLEKLITISGSEPLLAEAAYELMKVMKKSAARHLAEHSNLDCIDRGRRGELVAALLIMQSYDAARLISGQRWVSVANFMEALLPASSYETLLESAPTSWPMNGWPTDYENTFGAIFQNYCLWFNHIIKIESNELISIDHLWKFVTRGAMILCATNQEGIDILLPVHDMTQNLGPGSVTAIVIQVKNARRFGETASPSLFDAMDYVVKSGIFSTLEVDSVSDSDSESTTETLEAPDPPKPVGPQKKKRKVAPEPEMILKPTKVDLKRAKVDPKPVIRLILALGSPEPAVEFRERPEHQRYFDRFTAFDIWFAGLSCETFKQIREADLQSYKTLLERSLMPHDAFRLEDEPIIGNSARRARGACRRRIAPLTLPGCSHHSIHLPDAKEPGEGSRVDPASSVD